MVQLQQPKMCLLCKESIRCKSGIVLCSECRLPHHLKCWQDNKGCCSDACNGKKYLEVVAYDKEIYNPMRISLIKFKIGRIIMMMLFSVFALSIIISGYSLLSMIEKK